MMIDGIINQAKDPNSGQWFSLPWNKTNDNGYNGFGEVYFSSVKIDSIKAWKLHKK